MTCVRAVIQMKKMNEINEKLGKIVALAKNGIGGEKENALRIVKALCKKHHLDFDQVMDTSDQVREYTLKYKTKEEDRLLTHIIIRYAYDGDQDAGPIGTNEYRKVLFFKSTYEKYIEVLNAASVLLLAFKKEKKKAKDAVMYGFFEKHDLYANPSKKRDHSKKISKEEEALRAMGSSMSEAMDDVHIRKQLQ